MASAAEREEMRKASWLKRFGDRHSEKILGRGLHRDPLARRRSGGSREQPAGVLPRRGTEIRGGLDPVKPAGRTSEGDVPAIRGCKLDEVIDDPQPAVRVVRIAVRKVLVLVGDPVAIGIGRGAGRSEIAEILKLPSIGDPIAIVIRTVEGSG